MEGVDIKLEHERQRQADLLRQRMEEKRIKSNNLMQANEILDQASEAELLYVSLIWRVREGGDGLCL